VEVEGGEWKSPIVKFIGEAEKRILQALQEAYKELKRPKVGRMARLRGTVEPIADSPSEPTPTTRSWPKGFAEIRVKESATRE
jgi:hypothetical protein